MGALPPRAKYSTLAAEVSRRLRNTCEEIPEQEKAGILTRFCKAIESSGYGPLARAEAVWSGIKGHRNVQARREAGDIPETDQAWTTRGKRQIRKKREKATWFQKEKMTEVAGAVAGTETGGKETSWRHKEKEKSSRSPPTTTLYVSATPVGVLAKTRNSRKQT